MRFFFLCMVVGTFLCQNISIAQAKTVRDILIGYSYKGDDAPFSKADIIVKNTGKVLIALKYPKSLKYAFQYNLTEDEQAYLKTIILQAIKGETPDKNQTMPTEQGGEVSLFIALGQIQKKMKYAYTGVKHLYDLDVFMQKIMYQTHLVKVLESKRTVAEILKTLKTDMPVNGILHDDVIIVSLKKLIEKSTDFDTLSNGFIALSYMQTGESFAGYVSLKLNQYQTLKKRELWLTVLSNPNFHSELTKKTLKALFPVFATWVNHENFRKKESSEDIVLGFMDVMQDHQYINTPELESMLTTITVAEDIPAIETEIATDSQDTAMLEALKSEAKSMEIALVNDTQGIEAIENRADALLEEKNDEVLSPKKFAEHIIESASREMDIIEEKTKVLSEQSSGEAFTPSSIASQAMLMEIEELKKQTVKK